MKVVVSNFGAPVCPPEPMDYRDYWRSFSKPTPPHRKKMFELEHDWGFHIFSIGVYMLDNGIADEMEFWNFSDDRCFFWHPYGFYWMNFLNEDDLGAYLQTTRPPDLYVQHGGCAGRVVLQMLEGNCFRVYIPALRADADRNGNYDAECYLVDAEEYLDESSMMYIPVVNTRYIRPSNVDKKHDFIYLAQPRREKRHDIVIDAARKTGLRGHFHPVEEAELDLSDVDITRSSWNEIDQVRLMQESRIAVYSGIHESSPAAMWECVACDLPIVVNDRIEGGRHVVEPGVTGELSSSDNFAEVMQQVLRDSKKYTPREWLLKKWDTETTLKRYLDFFRDMSWQY